MDTQTWNGMTTKTAEVDLRDEYVSKMMIEAKAVLTMIDSEWTPELDRSYWQGAIIPIRG